MPTLSVELVADFVDPVILERYRNVHWWFTVGSRFVSRMHLWPSSLLRHRVVKSMKYFADIDAIARTIGLLRFLGFRPARC